MKQDDRPDTSDRSEYVAMLTREQTRLFSYITMLVGDVNDANNILQQTNVVLWQKAGEFELGSAFFPWAQKVAYFCTRSFLRDQKRDRHIFDNDTLHQLATAPMEADEDERRVALRHCLGVLSTNAVQMIQLRYGPGTSINQMAQKLGRSEGSVRMALMRIRESLASCIRRQMEEMA